MYDLIVRSALIYDGTLNKPFHGDVAVLDGKIAGIGEYGGAKAKRCINADGRALSPGFIDIHSHYDCAMFNDPILESVLIQGVTTVISGQCGDSRAPLSDDMLNDFALASKAACAGAEIDYNWRSFAELLDRIDEMRLGVNMGSLVGHSTVRRCVLGVENIDPTPKQLDEMKRLVSISLDEGALGFSSGLVYLPGMYAKTPELAVLASCLRPYGLPYMSHIRSEGLYLIEAVGEALSIARDAGIPCHIAHHKALGKPNWHKITDTLAMIDSARNGGMDVTLDLYPYVYSTSSMRAMLPQWAQEGGIEAANARLKDPVIRARIAAEIEAGQGLNNIWTDSGGAEGVIAMDTGHTPQYSGFNMVEASRLSGKTPIETALDIILLNNGWDTGCYTSGCEDNIRRIIAKPYSMIGSDAVPCTKGAKCNPRTNGTFPRVLGKYAREEGVLSMEAAIHKITGAPANRLKLRGKGFIAPGMDADITMFDPAAVKDMASVSDPFQRPLGIDYVFVGGACAIDGAKYTGARAGRAVRRA